MGFSFQSIFNAIIGAGKTVADIFDPKDAVLINGVAGAASGAVTAIIPPPAVAATDPNVEALEQQVAQLSTQLQQMAQLLLALTGAVHPTVNQIVAPTVTEPTNPP